MTVDWLVILPALGIAGLILDWYISRDKRPKRNIEADILYKVWRMLPGDMEFVTDERDQPDQSVLPRS